MEHFVLLITIFFILGIFTGALGGLLGLGGGTIVVPSLMYIFSLLDFNYSSIIHLAIGTSMTCNLFSMTSATRAHATYRQIDYKLFLIFLPGLLLGSIIGPHIAYLLPPAKLKFAFGVILLCVATLMLFKVKPHIQSTVNAKQPDVSKKFPLPVTALISLIVSIIASISGLASGTFMIPILSFYGLELRKSIGTSSITGMVISLVATINYLFLKLPSSPEYSQGFVYLPAAIIIGTSSVIFTHLFAKMSAHIPSHILRKSFIVILAIISILMLKR